MDMICCPPQNADPSLRSGCQTPKEVEERNNSFHLPLVCFAVTRRNIWSVDFQGDG
jgi:hypothetical protein